MTDKEIEAGIKRACECDCAPPSTGWTVNPFPIIRDYIERLKHRSEVAMRALLDCMKDSRPAHCSIAICSKWTRCGDDTCVETRRAIFIEQAEREIEAEKGE